MKRAKLMWVCSDCVQTVLSSCVYVIILTCTYFTYHCRLYITSTTLIYCAVNPCLTCYRFRPGPRAIRCLQSTYGLDAFHSHCSSLYTFGSNIWNLFVTDSKKRQKPHPLSLARLSHELQNMFSFPYVVREPLKTGAENSAHSSVDSRRLVPLV